MRRILGACLLNPLASRSAGAAQPQAGAFGAPPVQPRAVLSPHGRLNTWVDQRTAARTGMLRAPDAFVGAHR
jgi:hypothetical protein